MKVMIVYSAVTNNNKNIKTNIIRMRDDKSEKIITNEYEKDYILSRILNEKNIHHTITVYSNGNVIAENFWGQIEI